MDVQFETAPRDNEEMWLELAADNENPTTCPHCGGHLMVIQPAPAPHWARLHCQQCSKFHGWLRTPDSELGQHYRMPLGCYKGRTLDDIATTGRGRGYIAWAAENMNINRVRNACRRYLETKPADRTRESPSGKPVGAR